MEYKIRKTTKNDVEELSRLKQIMWMQTYRGIYSDDVIDNFDYEKHKNKFLKLIDNPDINFYVVESDNKLIGYMTYGLPTRPFRDYEQEIGLLYLLKEYQRNGIGRELFNIAFNGIKEKGYKEFFISCNKYNVNAQAFYKKMGGEVIYIDEDNIDKSIPQMYFLYKF